MRCWSSLANWTRRRFNVRKRNLRLLQEASTGESRDLSMDRRFGPGRPPLLEALPDRRRERHHELAAEGTASALGAAMTGPNYVRSEWHVGMVEISQDHGLPGQ